MKLKKAILFVLLYSSANDVSGQNPITPTGFYLADPSGHVWSDGKMYIYGSRDENKSYYCSHGYDVLSSDNLVNWTIHSDIFSSVGKKDKVPYSDGMLYAPDCIYKDGKYYLLYCMSGNGEVEGIASSDSPIGPFSPGHLLKGLTQIDPAGFVDDDGQAYIYWGQFSGKVAKLKPDMSGIDPATLKDSIITEAEHHFHEGIQMIKRNGIYYLIYAHIGRRGMATCIGYSYSNSPTGPFKYGGVIVDNYGCDPNVWNNHGSIVKYKDQWYVLYHRSTHGVSTMRKACIEPITFNENGTINEAEMTTQGAAGPLNPFEEMNAERACYLTGKVRIDTQSKNNEWLYNIENMNTVAYKYFDFRQQPKTFTICLAPKAGGKVIVFANNLCLPVLATIDVPAGDGEKLMEITVPVTDKITGLHPIYFRFQGKENENLFNIDWFRFNQ